MNTKNHSNLRIDGRKWDEIRKIEIIPGFIKNADGSVLISYGNTRVICTAKIVNDVPNFAKDKNIGWLTSEYAMLPASTNTRKSRERGKIDGRTVEIQRFIGRSLRGGIDLHKFPGYTLYVDADVIDADGGTRTASITGGFLAAALAFKKFKKEGLIEKDPIKNFVAAVSIGLVNGKIYLDLNYSEDSSAYCDMNVVATENGDIIDISASGEGGSFKKYQFDKMLNIALEQIQQLTELQKKIYNDYTRF